MAQVTVKVGMNQITTEAATVADVLNNENLKAVLGIPETSEVRRGEDILSANANLNEGDTIIIQKAAASKA